MIITFLEKLHVKFIWWKLGLQIKDFKKLVDLTKYMENHQPRSSFNLKDYVCDKL